MDQGMILLVDLSKIGSMTREVLGCFILSLLHLTAVSRANIPETQRKQFHIHCDEAHRFITDSLEDIIAETRKYRVSLMLSHQYLKQFTHQKTDAFSSVGSTIIFNVNKQDANYLCKDLQNKADVNDLISLELGEAIVRIGSEIVKIQTPRPAEISSTTFKERIIQESYKKYYQPAHEIRNWIYNRAQRWHQPFTPLGNEYRGLEQLSGSDFDFDEFD